jgi:hypothetical protein
MFKSEAPDVVGALMKYILDEINNKRKNKKTREK